MAHSPWLVGHEKALEGLAIYQFPSASLQLSWLLMLCQDQPRQGLDHLVELAWSALDVPLDKLGRRSYKGINFQEETEKKKNGVLWERGKIQLLTDVVVGLVSDGPSLLYFVRLKSAWRQGTLIFDDCVRYGWGTDTLSRGGDRGRWCSFSRGVVDTQVAEPLAGEVLLSDFLSRSWYV